MTQNSISFNMDTHECIRRLTFQNMITATCKQPRVHLFIALCVIRHHLYVIGRSQTGWSLDAFITIDSFWWNSFFTLVLRYFASIFQSCSVSKCAQKMGKLFMLWSGFMNDRDNYWHALILVYIVFKLQYLKWWKDNISINSIYKSMTSFNVCLSMLRATVNL